MTTEVRFYHLTRKTLEQALPEMLEKTVERGWRAVVMAGSAERVEALTQMLWSYSPNGFLAHGNAKDGYAEMQPIWLTERDERPNRAEVLFLIDGASCAEAQGYQRVCELFDGNDEGAVTEARRRWRDYVAKAGTDGEVYALSYWQQGVSGWVDATPKATSSGGGQ
ncbi:MAG: DNA polymerase III subunit chi [Bdellovibrionales bacterium]